MILVDANLLVYAHVASFPQHQRARTWLDGRINAAAPVGLPWPSLMAFARIVSNPRIFDRPVAVSAAWRQAETQCRFARDQAASQVKSLVELADEARARARGQRLAVQQAQRGFEIASAQYREGLSGRLELTDAEVALRQSEFNYAQAVYDYLVAWAQLDEAVGAVPMVDSEFTLADGQ